MFSSIIPKVNLYFPEDYSHNKLHKPKICVAMCCLLFISLACTIQFICFLLCCGTPVFVLECLLKRVKTAVRSTQHGSRRRSHHTANPAATRANATSASFRRPVAWPSSDTGPGANARPYVQTQSHDHRDTAKPSQQHTHTETSSTAPRKPHKL